MILSFVTTVDVVLDMENVLKANVVVLGDGVEKLLVTVILTLDVKLSMVNVIKLMVFLLIPLLLNQLVY